MKPRSILMFGAFLLQNSSNLCSDVVSRSMKKQNKTKKKKADNPFKRYVRVATAKAGALLGSVNSLTFFFKGGCTLLFCDRIICLVAVYAMIYNTTSHFNQTISSKSYRYTQKKACIIHKNYDVRNPKHWRIMKPFLVWSFKCKLRSDFSKFTTISEVIWKP